MVLRNANDAARQTQDHGLHKNYIIMSLDLAPTAMRSPISRVRSVTDTNMMFMIPTTPTRREINAMLSLGRIMASYASALLPLLPPDCSWHVRYATSMVTTSSTKLIRVMNCSSGWAANRWVKLSTV
jgi:hypothetical protein